nr:zinc finger BED domain-containing protein RICESLEEPER 2 [Tanacetum cinerariifolium]
MMKRVIAFEDFSVLRAGSALARMLRNMFIVFNLEIKLLSITLDNASNNTNAIGKLELKYDPPMDGRFYHSRCVAHVINLVVQEELLIETISTDLEFFYDGHATKAKKWFNDSLEGLYNIYYAKYGNPTTQSRTRASSSRVSGGNQIINLLNRLKEHKNKKARSDSSLSSEYERYVHSNFITHLQYSEFAGFDVLGFWKEKESIFPILSRMAIDLISVQATSLAFESAFSTSGWVLSIRRTKLTPISLQMCICLKDHLDAQERKQHTSTLENALDFEDEILDAEVQENEATPLFDKEIALDVASQGTMASGFGRRRARF